MNQRFRSWLFVWLLLGVTLLMPLSTAVGFELEGMACLDCHAELREQKVLHAAIEDSDSCTLCHEQLDPEKHGFAPFGADIATAVCGQCHDPWSGSSEPHPPVADGDCLLCHNPHQSDQPALLTAPQGELCLQCHDADAFSGVSVHGPVTINQCGACHDPHAADLAKLLRDPVPALCWRCHDKAQTDGAGVSLPPSKPLFENSEAQLHPPFAAGDCGDCHLPHAAAQIRLLNETYPGGFYQGYSEAAYQLCLNCHDSAAFNEPRTLSATAFRNGNLNLHHRHVNKDKGRSCRTCHTPHGSHQPRLITGGFRFGERTLGLSFEATDTGGSCTSNCHVKAVYDRLEPAFNALRASPRPPGQDATPEELQKAGGTGPR